MKELNMENANDHPFKVSIVKDAEFFANSHPYKVSIEGGGGGGNEGRVVDELPEEGEPGYIYLVLKEHTPEGDIYDEYMWVLQQDGETYGWEHIGATNEIRLGSIYTLTTADYNWNRSTDSQTEPYDCVAVWLLESGVYTTDGEVNFYPVKSVSIHGPNAIILHTKSTGQPLGYGKTIVFNGQEGYFYEGVNGGVAAFSRTLVNPFIEQTTGQDTTRLMSQKAITDAINTSKGGVRTLTVDDYNWNSVDRSTSGTLDSFALWLLDDGLYSFENGITTSKLKTDKTNNIPGAYANNNNQAPTILILSGTDAYDRRIKTFMGTESNGSNGENAFFVIGTDTDGVTRWGTGETDRQYGLTRRDVINDLNGGGNSGDSIPLSAYQGKVLNDKIGQIETVLQTLTTGTGV